MDRLNIRRTPNLRSAVLRILDKGTKVRLTGETNKDWTKVQIGNLRGWVGKSFLRFSRPPATVSARQATANTRQIQKVVLTKPATVRSSSIKKVAVLADRLNVRKTPSNKAIVINILREGSQVEILAKQGADWVKIQKGALQGWVARKYLQFTPLSTAGAVTKDGNKILTITSSKVEKIKTHTNKLAKEENRSSMEKIKAHTNKLVKEENRSSMEKIKAHTNELVKEENRSSQKKKVQQQKAIVTANRLNIRQSPGVRYPITDILRQGSMVEILKYAKSDWVKVQKGNAIGWVAKEFLRFGQSPQEEKETVFQKAIVRVNKLNVRVNPGEEYRITHVIPQNTMMSVLSDSSEEWIEIQTPYHIRGWVARKYVSFLTTTYSQPMLPTKDLKEYYAIVKVKKLNIRTGPGKHYPVIKSAVHGKHMYSLQEEQKGWVKVRSSNNIQGWVAKRYLHYYAPKSLDLHHWEEVKNDYTSPLEAGILSFLVDSYQKRQINPQDELSMVVQDLNTGKRLVSINSKKQVKAASLIKIPILHAYTVQKYRKQIRHTKKKQNYLASMIQYSNNNSTNQIMKYLGGPQKVFGVLHKTGFYKRLKVVEYIPKYGKTYQNKISANDLNVLLNKLWSNQILGANFSKVANEQASTEMLYLLGLPGRKQARDRLKDGTCYANNRSIRIWDKTGFVKGLNGNAGILEIDTPRGRIAYTVTTIVDREKFKTISGSGNGWSFNISQQMRRMSELAYAYMTVQYGSYNECGSKPLTYHTRRAFQNPKKFQIAM